MLSCLSEKLLARQSAVTFYFAESGHRHALHRVLSCRSEKLARQSVVMSYFAESGHILLCRVLSFRSKKLRR